jgi:hypothetical protein
MSHSVDVNLTACVFERKNANPQGRESVLITLSPLGPLEQLSHCLAVGNIQCEADRFGFIAHG